MSEMVERVAEAIRDRRTQADFHAVKDGHWIIDHDKELARAAIEAMREPTLPMVAAAVKRDWKGETDPTWAEGYRAMIDAALPKQEQG